MNLGWFGVDELTYCKEDAWTRLEGRLRHPKARYKCGFAVWTPKGHDWVWRKFISGRKVQHYQAILARPFENRAVLDATPDFYENLRHSYEERFFRQEVLGEYLDMYSGAAYHSFSADNVAPCSFDPRKPLIWTLDFNVNPMSSCLCQVDEHGRYKTVHVLAELSLRESSTDRACKEFLRRIQPWREAMDDDIEVRVYGDASGGNRSATTGSSCWDVVQEVMKSQRGIRFRWMWKRRNPDVVVRVAAVNNMLCSFGDGHRSAGERHIVIDPSCSELIADLEEVKWMVDNHGASIAELDKRDNKRTHMSDAFGYFIEAEHGYDSRGTGALRDSII
jgi:hypothetical protein